MNVQRHPDILSEGPRHQIIETKVLHQPRIDSTLIKAILQIGLGLKNRLIPRLLNTLKGLSGTQVRAMRLAEQLIHPPAI